MSHEDRRPSGEALVAAVGAVLFASDEPVQPREIANAFGRMPVQDIEDALERLAKLYDGTDLGIRLERIAGGVQLATRSDVGAWVRGYFRQRNRTRLSPAALETLAVIAYRQPATSPEIQAIRGKDPSASLRGLVEKGLVRCLGRKKVVGSPLLYGTSREFLVHFGLDSLDDLPSIEDFDQFLEILDAAQLAGGGEAEPETEAVASAATSDATPRGLTDDA